MTTETQGQTMIEKGYCKMKTLEQIQTVAASMAESYFYADPDEKIAWEPFEHYSQAWVEEQADNMAEMLVRCMLWAQKDTLPA